LLQIFAAWWPMVVDIIRDGPLQGSARGYNPNNLLSKCARLTQTGLSLLVYCCVSEFCDTFCRIGLTTNTIIPCSVRSQPEVEGP